jgi:hypothetical protein
VRVALSGPMSLLVVASVAAIGVPAAGSQAAASAIAAPKQFAPTGHQQVYTVPSGVLLEGVVAVGGSGGSDDPQPSGSPIGADGATLQGYLATRPGETLYVEVGQSGKPGGAATFGGGGAAGGAPPGVKDCATGATNVPCSGPWAGAGGGASDVRTCSELVASCKGGGTSTASRLIVAAGAGGVGGQGLNGDGAGCDNPEDGGGEGHNGQLPTASPAGPAAIHIAGGIVIPGFAGGNVSTVTTTDGSTNAAMGKTAAGAGGVRTACTVNTTSYSGSVAGRSGSGANGGSGGSASGPCCGGQTTFAPGAGGGGGGGYFGGGGGATGMGTCSPSPCGNGGTGEGGAAGSSFVSKAIEYPDAAHLFNTGDVFIEFVPAIEIDRPANGAVYSSGQVVDASWSCGYSSTTALGASGCKGTDASGGRISTAPGTHTFTVTGEAANRRPLSVTVTYTVKG